MKKDWKAIKWLYDELPELVSEGVIGHDSAEALRRRYGEVPPRDSSKLILTLFSILGALLVGAGLIMIVAHNWNILDRLARTFVALLPLTASLCALGFIYIRNETRAAIVEPLCAFQTLALGAAMGIIGQTYNVGGEFSTLLLFWCVAAIPLAYIFDSVIAGSLCVGILSWHLCESYQALESWQAWLGMAAVIPYVAKVMLKERGSGRAAFLGWCAAIGTTISVVDIFTFHSYGYSSSIELLALPCFFSALFFAGAIPEGPSLPAWRNPLRTAGAIGAGIMAIVISLDKYMDIRIWSPSYGVDALTYAFLAFCVAGVAILCMRRRFWDIPFGLVGLLAFVSSLCASPFGHSTYDPSLILQTVFSIAALALGVISMVSGVREDSFGRLNGGIVIVMAWLIGKFFSSDLDFLFKGLLFIVLGGAFIAFNVMMIIKRRKASRKEVAA